MLVRSNKIASYVCVFGIGLFLMVAMTSKSNASKPVNRVLSNSELQRIHGDNLVGASECRHKGGCGDSFKGMIVISGQQKSACLRCTDPGNLHWNYCCTGVTTGEKCKYGTTEACGTKKIEYALSFEEKTTCQNCSVINTDDWTKINKDCTGRYEATGGECDK